jgi:hypothetical protein
LDKTNEDSADGEITQYDIFLPIEIRMFSFSSVTHIFRLLFFIQNINMSEDKVRVKTSDGDILEVDLDVAKQWGPINNMYEGKFLHRKENLLNLIFVVNLKFSVLSIQKKSRWI